MRIKILLILLLLTSPVSAQRQARPMMEYPTPYYIIHTDLTGDQLREAELRMTRMAEEYHARTHQFAGDIHSKLPFFLFTREQDYYDAGGATGTAGEFDPANNRLMAIADLGADGYPWHVIQHEGFHQFAHAVIGGELPIWVNEGMAEYFGEGLFTGDGFVTGVVPPERLAHIKQAMEDKQFRPIKEMMLLAHKDWNDEMSLTNYDQAWSMVQFLAHGENGKYQGAFVNFMRAIGRGQQWTPAWIASFGSAEGFEEKWQAYWRDLPRGFDAGSIRPRDDGDADERPGAGDGAAAEICFAGRDGVGGEEGGVENRSARLAAGVADSRCVCRRGEDEDKECDICSCAGRGDATAGHCLHDGEWKERCEEADRAFQVEWHARWRGDGGYA